MLRQDHWYPPLTPQQLEAVEDRADAIFINGDGGTGLTHVLCSRGLRHMQEGMGPQDVLYLTWSLEGAAAIRRTFRRWEQEAELQAGNAPTPERRASALLLAENARCAQELHVLTVMQFCLAYLRNRAADLGGLNPHFSLLTRRQQLELVSRLAYRGAATRSLSTVELREFLLWHRRDLACTNYLDEGYAKTPLCTKCSSANSLTLNSRIGRFRCRRLTTHGWSWAESMTRRDGFRVPWTWMRSFRQQHGQSRRI